VRSGKLLSDVVVRIREEHIVSVEDADGIESSGMRTIELPGFTLLPGSIDAHTHLTYELADDWIDQAVVESVTDRGAIEPGILADLIAVEGDPLEDVPILEDVGFAMIGGRVAKSLGASHPEAVGTE
jgi:imidazolonepropionase-like amidohydrolase